MCGIVGAVTQRPVQNILLEGLKRLEYRGYDSAGLVLWEGDQFHRVRRCGKVQVLADALNSLSLKGVTGIAHTRWATHGVPSEKNAHPHISSEKIAVVHNGIIENYEELKEKLLEQGYEFTSDTDTEVVAHLVASLEEQTGNTESALKAALLELEGAYALGVISQSSPNTIYAARKGSPLVIGVGIGEHFIASDPLALLPVTDRFIYLEEGDFTLITQDRLTIYDQNNQIVERPVVRYEYASQSSEKGLFKHYMMKEIYEQPEVMRRILVGRIHQGLLIEQVFGDQAAAIFDQVKAVQIVACGTSYHAGMVARYWIEELVGIPCQVEVASEFRYRKTALVDGTLFVAISQSGETADTLAALRDIRPRILASLAICNVPGSSLIRESDLILTTEAGPEIGVASTKAFTSQLVALLLMTLALGRRYGLSEEKERQIIAELQELPEILTRLLALDASIESLATSFAEKHNALFLGRGALFPVALEGALKLKEISYIHAEAYPAGELKHGPLALVDKDMPVVAVVPDNQLLDKLKANLQEVSARGGELFVFSGKQLGGERVERELAVPVTDPILEPIVYTLPLQLLAYHVAVLKGTDVDQPRNLAKSVTVE